MIIKREIRNGGNLVYGVDDVDIDDDKWGLHIHIPYDKSPTDFFDFNKHIFSPNPWIRTCFTIMYNGTGKTFSAYKIFIKELVAGNFNIGGRLSKEQVAKAVQGGSGALSKNSVVLSEMVEDGEISAQQAESVSTGFKCDNKGVYQVIQRFVKKSKNRETGEMVDIFKEEKGDYYIPFVYVSSIANSCPSVEGCSGYLIDEILNGDEQRKTKVDDFNFQGDTLISRTARAGDDEHPIRNLFIANPHTLESDVFSAYAIDTDGDETFAKHGCIGYKKGQFLYIDPRSGDYLKTNARIKKFHAEQGQDTTADPLYAHRLFPERYKRVIPIGNEEKEGLYNIAISPRDIFAVYEIVKDGELYLGIDKIRNHPDVCDGTTYGFTPEANARNVIILNGARRTLECCEILIQAVINGTIFFDSPFTDDKCKGIQSLFRLYAQFLEQQKNH